MHISMMSMQFLGVQGVTSHLSIQQKKNWSLWASALAFEGKQPEKGETTIILRKLT